MDEVQHVLKDAGFSPVESVDQLESGTFCQDPHCEDTLVFPAQAKAELRNTNLLSEHKLIIQVCRCQWSKAAVLVFHLSSFPFGQLWRRHPTSSEEPVSSHKSVQIVEKTPVYESDWTKE